MKTHNIVAMYNIVEKKLQHMVLNANPDKLNDIKSAIKSDEICKDFGVGYVGIIEDCSKICAMMRDSNSDIIAHDNFCESCSIETPYLRVVFNKHLPRTKQLVLMGKLRSLIAQHS